MANAKLLQVADAVVEVLNAHTFAMPFTAERVYIPLVQMDKLMDDGLKVWVLPRSFRGERSTRLSFNEEHLVDIGICTRVSGEWEPGQLDQLVDLADEIATYLRGEARVLANAQATCINIEANPVFSPEQLFEQHVYLAVLSATYRTYR